MDDLLAQIQVLRTRLGTALMRVTTRQQSTERLLHQLLKHKIAYDQLVWQLHGQHRRASGPDRETITTLLADAADLHSAMGTLVHLWETQTTEMFATVRAALEQPA